VTLDSQSIRARKQSTDWSTILNSNSLLNLALILFVVFGFAYYIAGVNAVTSGKYDVSDQRSKITSLIESQGLLSARKSTTEDPVAAMNFAQAQNMVEAKDIVYVFENNNVAIRQ